MRHNTESKKWAENYCNLSFQLSLYACVVMGGASLSTGNAGLAYSSQSCFCFTLVRTAEPFSCCLELSSSM